MPYDSCRFHRPARARKRLGRVEGPVSPVLEMTEIQSRLLAEGSAVLFENVVGRAAAATTGPCW